MIRTKIARFAGYAAGAALVLGVVAPASAQTIAQLQAQIAALMAQLQALQGGTGVTNAISSDLTVGSSGQSVVVLQNALIAQGYLTMPAGVSTGYFGALTKAAVMKWQAANGLPSTGYFGPMSRAKFNAGGTAGTTTGGTTTGGTTASGTISTPGAEGTLTVTSAPVSNSTLYEGQTNKDVLAFKAKATGSDLAVQRVKVDLGTDNNIYRDAFSKLSLVDDAGKTLASADLNSTTVIKNSSNRYELTLAGFSSIVAKDATRTYTLKTDVNDVVDTLTSYTFSLAANGVRAIDGAGIDQYSPALITDVARSITIAANLVDSASLTVSANNATPLTREIVAADGSSNNEADKVTFLVFDVRAEKDDVKMTDLVATITTNSASANGTASTTYLYAGNGTSGTMIGSASLSAGTATFSDIDYVVPKGTTKTFTLAADIRSAGATQVTFAASVAGSSVTAENSEGGTVTPTGTASGNNVLVRNVGPVFTLVSKSITASGAPQSSTANTYSTSSLTATFKVHAKAVGADVLFGTGASSSPMWNNSANYFKVYKAGAYDGTISSAATTTSITLPDSPTAVTNTVTLSKDQEADFTVSYTILGRNAASAAVAAQNSPVAVQMMGIGWISSNGAATSTFMADAPSWRTAEVSFP